MSLMTTAQCTVNPLRTNASFTFTSSGGVSFGLNPIGIPASSLRDNDYYLMSAIVVSNAMSRTSTVAFHNSAARTLALAPALPAAVVTEAPGSYKRLQLTLAGMSVAYNRSVSLQYGDPRAPILVKASRDYFNGAAAQLTTPDLSAVAGWPSGVGSTSGSGTWRVVAEGNSSDGAGCVEDRTTVTGIRTGSY
jgi:hypothetical protein